MALKFGTSGVRGLVLDMSDAECYLYTKSFVQYVKKKCIVTPKVVALAGDYRSSTTWIKDAVAYAIYSEGLRVSDCGTIATPAVTAYGINLGIPSIMVTGSHITADRNGIKFNMPWGEILKDDEAEIFKGYNSLRHEEELLQLKDSSIFRNGGAFKRNIPIEKEEVHEAVARLYEERFISFFPQDVLSGLKVVFYEHSTVSRDIGPKILRALGAEVICVKRSDVFVAVDTEAIDNPNELANWVLEHKADALVSADGDGDRALVVDEKGQIVQGDIIGTLAAEYLQADSISIPVSCNTALEKCGKFKHIRRTKIGSPFVIESMYAAVNEGKKRVVGFEANGGFLTGTAFTHPDTGHTMKALPTRDAMLPIIAFLSLCRKTGKTASDLIETLPQRFTYSGLLREFPQQTAREFLGRFTEKGFAEKLLNSSFGEISSIDFSDGVRITFVEEDIVHLRPSGNAPEFRCYTESSSKKRAIDNFNTAIEIVRLWKEKHV